jgi:hypothetical protein
MFFVPWLLLASYSLAGVIKTNFRASQPNERMQTADQ